MKKILLIILFSGIGIQFSQAQRRIGLELGFVPVSTMELNYLDKDLYTTINFPQLGVCYQRWVTDRRFIARSLTLQNYKMIDMRPSSEYRVDYNLGVLHYSFGYGFYLNHKEFEDDFASYISPNVGLGYFIYKQMEYEAGSSKGVETLKYWDGFVSFSLGYGVEKSLNRKWLLNASVDGHMQMFDYNPLYVSLSCRLLYRTY